ncbi:transposase [Chloroflexota bacterium]
MPPAPQYKRKSTIRLPGYDYAQPGGYYVTICTHDRGHLFGKIINRQMILNTYGHIVQHCWQDIPNHYPHAILDAYIIMPNHVHGIIELTSEDSPGHRHTLSEIMRGFKTYSARRINEQRALSAVPVWQRSFFDHIIRTNDLGTYSPIHRRQSCQLAI